MSDNNEFLPSDSYEQNTIDILINTEAHKVSDEEKSKLGNGADKENEALRQNTVNIQSNTHALKLLNKEKEKSAELNSQSGITNIKKITPKALYKNALNNNLYETAIQSLASRENGVPMYTSGIKDEKGYFQFFDNKNAIRNNSKNDNIKKIERKIIPSDRSFYLDEDSNYSLSDVYEVLEFSNKKKWADRLKLNSYSDSITGKHILDTLSNSKVNERDILTALGFIGTITKIGNSERFNIPTDTTHQRVHPASVEFYDNENIKSSNPSRIIYHNVVEQIYEDIKENFIKSKQLGNNNIHNISFGERYYAPPSSDIHGGSTFSRYNTAWREYPYSNKDEILGLLNNDYERKIITNGIDTKVIAEGIDDKVEYYIGEYIREILLMKIRNPDREIVDIHNHPYGDSYEDYYGIRNGRLPSNGDEYSWSIEQGLVSHAINTNDSNSLRVFDEKIPSDYTKVIVDLINNKAANIRFGPNTEQNIPGVQSVFDPSDLLNDFVTFYDIVDSLGDRIQSIKDGIEYPNYNNRLKLPISDFDPGSGLSHVQQSLLLNMQPEFDKNFGIQEYLSKYMDAYKYLGTPAYAKGFFNIIDTIPGLTRLQPAYNFGITNTKGFYEDLFNHRYPESNSNYNVIPSYYNSDNFNYVHSLHSAEIAPELATGRLKALENLITILSDNYSKIENSINTIGVGKTRELLESDVLGDYRVVTSARDGKDLYYPYEPYADKLSNYDETPFARAKGNYYWGKETDPNELLRSLASTIESFRKMIEDLTNAMSKRTIGNGDAISVHDMVLTDDGRLIKTDPKDTLVALANPAASFGAMQNIRNERGEVVGILSNADAARIDKLTDTMAHFSKMSTRPEQFNGYNEAKRAVDEILQIAKENKHFYDLALESDKKTFNHSSAYLQTYGFGEYLPIFEDIRNRNYINDFGNEIAASIDNGKNARAAYLAVANVRHASLVGESYSPYGLAGEDFAYPTDGWYKNEKIKDFREKVRNSIQEYTESALDKAAKAFRGTLFNPEDDKQFIKNKAPLLLDSPQWWKEAQEEYADVKRRMYEKEHFAELGVQEYEKKYNMALVPVGNSYDYIESNFAKTGASVKLDTRSEQILEEERKLEAEQELKRKQELIEARKKELSNFISESDSDMDVRRLRDELSIFGYLSKIINKFQDDPLQTLGEKGLITLQSGYANSLGNFDEWGKELNSFTGEYEDVFYGRTGLMGKYQTAREQVLDTMDYLNSGVLTDDEILEKTGNLNNVMQNYQDILRELLETQIKYNETLKKQLDEEYELNSESKKKSSVNIYDKKKKNISDNVSQSQNNSYDSYKYALIRTKKQDKEFKASLPWQFSATGNLKDAFRITMFNKSVGYRQRQGLSGFLANIGYKDSGTLASIGLGSFASALTKASKAVLNFAAESTRAFGEIESIRTNLGIVYGSQAEADSTFSEIAQYSVKSPFGVQTVSEYAVLLKQSGIYASDLMDTLKQIGDVAGGNQQKFSNIANAFSQIEANGKATTRQLRQLATAGIPIYKELAKETGKSVENVRKMTEQGKITSDIIETVFQNMTGAGGMFENAVEIGAKTWKARQQNLADARQLAQAEFGKTVINAFGTGQGDSLAQILLEFKESLYENIQYLAELHNIKKSVSNIEKQESELKTLQTLYNNMEANGATPESLQVIKDRINKVSNYFTPEQQRANAEALYDAMKDKYNIGNEFNTSNQVSDREYSRLKALVENTSYYTNKKGTKFYEKSAEGVDVLSREDYNRRVAEQADAQAKLATVYSEVQLEKFYKAVKPEDIEKAYSSIANKIFSSGFENLDKAMNKNSKGLYTFYQKGEQAFEGTSLGKELKQKKDIKEWNDTIALYDKVRPLFDEQGRLVDTFNGTIEDVIEALKTGLVQPLENLATKPELLASDYTYNLAVNKDKRRQQLEERSSNWSKIISNVKNLDAVQNASDITREAYKAIEIFQGNVLGLSNTQEGIAEFNKQILILKDTLERTGNEALLPIIEQLTTTRTITPKLRDYWEANGEPVDPLWRRVESSKLGIDIGLMRRTNMSARSGLSLGMQKLQRQNAASFLKSYIQSYGETGKFIKQDGLVNPYDGGTTAVDMRKTTKSMSNFVLSLENAIGVTKAFASGVESDLNVLTDFYTAAMFDTEEQQNIYDEKYKDLLGPLFNTLGATEVQGFSLLADEDGHLRKQTMDTVEAIIKQKSALLTTTNTLISFRESVKSASESAQQAKQAYDVISGKYSTGVLGNLSSDKQTEFLNSIKAIWAGNETLQNKFSLSDFVDAGINGTLASKLSINVPGEKKEEVNGLYKDTSEEKTTIDDLKKIAEETLTRQSNIELYTENNENFIKGVINAGNSLNEDDYNKIFKETALKEYFRDLYNTENPIASFAPINEKYKSRYLEERTELTEKYISESIAEHNKGLEKLKEYNSALKKLEEKESYNSNEKIRIDEENQKIRLENMAVDNAEQNNKAASDLAKTILDLFNQIMKEYVTTTATEFYKILAGSTNSQNEDIFTKGIEKKSVYEMLSPVYGYGIQNSLPSWSTPNNVATDTSTGGVGKGLLNWFLGPQTDIVYGNDYKTQRALNAIGANDKTITQFMREGFMNKDGKWLEGEEQKSNMDKVLDEYAKLKAMNPSEFEEFKKTFDIQSTDFKMKNLEQFIKEIGTAIDETKLFEDAVNSLGDSVKDAFQKGILDGWNNSMQAIGRNLVNIVSYESKGVGFAEDLTKVWKDVGKGILETLGPTMAQIGLQLLPTNWQAGAALIGASGVAGILSGMLNAKSDDKQDETSKLQTLKQLLSDIIDQAKIDADYYQKNILHENAISESYKVSSVHDAVISSHGNIITTDPKDFLIATKNPGSLSGNGEVKINFNFIDKSTGGKVQVQSTSQRRNIDGSIDIEAVVVATVNKALANGDLDKGMGAMNHRLNGYSFAG